MQSDQVLVLPHAALKRINAALALRDIPDYEAALKQLEEALTLIPDDDGLHLLLGLTYQDLQRPLEAEEHFRYSLRLNPSSEQTRQALGVHLFHQGQLVEAAEILQPFIDQKTPYPNIWQLYATIKRNQGNAEEALAILREAYTRWPNNVDLLNQLGHMLVELDRREEALPILESALVLMPSTGVLCDLALIHAVSEDYDTAIQLLEQAIDRRPENSRAWRGIAYCYLKLNQLEKAHEAATKALRFDGNHFRSWQMMADVLLALDRGDEAFDVIEKGIALARSAKDGQIVLENLMGLRAIELLQKEGPEATLAQIEIDLAEVPDNEGLAQLKTNLLIATNQLEEAIAFLEKLKQVPLDITQLEELAGKFLQYGYIESVQQLYVKILEIEPQHSLILNNLGFIVAGQDQWEYSANLLQQALDTGFEMPTLTLSNLGYVRLRQGMFQDAIAIFANLEHEIVHEEVAEEAAIVRIASWHNNDFLDPFPDRFPRRPVSLLMAARANLAIAQFLVGHRIESLATAQRAIEAAPDDPIGFAVLGCLYLADNRPEDAQMTWQAGIQQSENKRASKTVSRMKDWMSAITL